ncbi:hypothetical protein PENSPDRAFT_691295 [Peniophora sp. CONT]|nr:hypothetical protein PENSPDRAFT_691295 [Peniophora sp. CONT]
MSGSPIASPSAGPRASPGARDSPSLTVSQLRSRGNGSAQRGLASTSPTTSTFSESVSTHVPARSLGSIITSNSTSRPVIRSDPGLVTCFDSADKELYDLWAPRT